MLSKQDGRVLFWAQYSYAMSVVYAHECRRAEKAVTLRREAIQSVDGFGWTADDILDGFTDPTQLQEWMVGGRDPRTRLIPGRFVRGEKYDKQYSKDYYQEHRKQIRASCRRYYLANREYLLAKAKHRYREKTKFP